MIKHHFRHTAGLEHAMHLADRAGRIRRVMQDTVRVDNVEARIAEGQVLAVRDHEVAAGAVKTETIPRDLNRSWRQIDPGAACATTRKLQQVRAHAATNFQQLRPAKLIEAHQSRHPRGVLAVTIALDFVEKLACAELVFAIVFGATRVLTPLLTRAQFLFSQSAHHPVLTLGTLQALYAHCESTYALVQQLLSPFLPN